MLSKRNLYVDDLAIFAEQFLELFFGHLIGQVHDVKPLLINEWVLQTLLSLVPAFLLLFDLGGVASCVALLRRLSVFGR